MSEPTGPDRDPEYDAALDRFLDGLLDDPGTPVDAQVRADTDAIAKALGLIGGAFADGGSTVSATAGAVPPAAAGGATVVAMSGWRSKLNPRVLAAAATLVVLLGVGVPIAMSTGGSSDSDTAASAPADPAADLAQAESAPQAGAPAPLAADAYGAVTGSAPGAATTGTDTSTTAGKSAGSAGTVPGAGTGAAGGSAMDPKSAADAPAFAAGNAARQAATPEFEQAVACARAIVTGTATAIQPDPDGQHYTVTILVEKWIAPEKTGPLTISLRVLGPNVNSPGPDESLRAGMRRLWVFGPSEDERAYAFQEPDWAATKKTINAVREQRAGEGC